MTSEIDAKARIAKSFWALESAIVKVETQDNEKEMFEIRLASIPDVTQEEFLEHTNFGDFLGQERKKHLMVTNYRPKPEDSIGADERLHNYLSVDMKRTIGIVEDLKLSEGNPLTVTGKLVPLETEQSRKLEDGELLKLAPRMLIDRHGHINIVCFDIVS
jgi:hypothetical protein